VIKNEILVMNFIKAYSLELTDFTNFVLNF